MLVLGFAFRLSLSLFDSLRFRRLDLLFVSLQRFWCGLWFVCSAYNRRSRCSTAHRTANKNVRSVISCFFVVKFQQNTSKPAMFVDRSAIILFTQHQAYNLLIINFHENRAIDSRKEILFVPFNDPLLVATSCL